MLATKPLKPRACKHCKSSFTPTKRLQVVCSPLCGLERARIQREAKERKEHAARKRVERAMDRKRRDALRTFPELEEDCRKIVQKIARIRDRNDGCISCDLPANWDGQWHGSHFRAHGSASAVQFHLWNIHKSCSPCNRDKGGNIHEYRPRLIAKIGQDRVDWLMAQNQTMKHTPAYRAYLMRFKQVMGKRLRRMEKRYA